MSGPYRKPSVPHGQIAKTVAEYLGAGWSVASDEPHGLVLYALERGCPRVQVRIYITARESIADEEMSILADRGAWFRGLGEVLRDVLGRERSAIHPRPGAVCRARGEP